MSVTENLVFKFVSFRGPIDGLTIDPTEDVPNSEIFKLLDSKGIVPELVVSEETVQLIENRPTLSMIDLSGSTLGEIHQILQSSKDRSVSNLQGPLSAFAETKDFPDNYRQVTDSWLTLKLLGKEASLIEKHEDLIRAAHIGQRMRDRSNTLREPGMLARLLKAQIVLPRGWRSARYRQQDMLKKYLARLKQSGEIGPSTQAEKIKQKKQEYAELEKRIILRESIQSKINATYIQWRKEKRGIEQPPPATVGPTASPRRTGGFLSRTFNFLFGTPIAVRAAPPRTSTPALDDNFYASIESRLTKEEKAEFGNAIGDTVLMRPANVEALLEANNSAGVIEEANDACARIRVWEAEETKRLPEAPKHETTEERPAVRAIGQGDLIVARERLIGYEANEIAHIENVLAGEKKVREHERTNTTEQVIETETTEEGETERDQQTTDRYELQTESQKTIEMEFSLEAGVNTSGQYGLTKVETSLDVGFQQSVSEARSSSVQLAQDIVSRAVERTFESVRELRRLTITEQIRELNQHTIDNVPSAGGTANSRSGVYLWAEKIHEVELRHYGTRLFVEFHVPEPAVSLLEQNISKPIDIRKPAPFTIGPADVTQGNYLCLAKLFGAVDVEPPPAQFINVGYAWASVPDEDVDYQALDVVATYIEIPDKYRPISGNARFSASTALTATWFNIFVAVGGITVIDQRDTNFGEGDFEFDPAYSWPNRPNSVPVSMRALAHHDKTLVLHITIRCERTPEALTEWKLRTWEQIRTGHQVLLRDYERAIEEADFSEVALFQIQGRPEAENRRIEQEELKKWAIKILRFSPNTPSFDFTAVETVGDFQEISPPGADFQAPIVRFYEEAFEWRHMTYVFYPYFWGRRETWKLRHQVEDNDSRFKAFLQAGAARVIVPVTPGYEDRILSYLDADPTDDEFSKINALKTNQNVNDGSKVNQDSDFIDLWLELRLARDKELALGSGTLDVKNGATLVTRNADSDPVWGLSERDLGRELYIAGDRYFIESIVSKDDGTFNLNEPYKGSDDSSTRYAAGSVPYGPPWLVRVPTSLVILSEEVGKLPTNG